MFSMKYPVVKNPIPPPQNAIVALVKDGSTITIDPITGNTIRALETINIGATITFYNSKQKVEMPEGGSLSSVPVFGYFISDIPEGYKCEGVVRMTYVRPNGNQVQGFLTVENTYTSAEANLAFVLGTPFKGIFTHVANSAETTQGL